MPVDDMSTGNGRAGRLASSHSQEPSRLAATLSLLLPGLGQLLNGAPGRAVRTMSITGLLVGLDWWIGQRSGTSLAVLGAMLFILPWWAFQSYDAYLPEQHSEQHSNERRGWSRTIHEVWASGHDIRYLGCLFLLTALTDLYIIVANPTYTLTIFCAKPAGIWGLMAKVQSPTLHVLIGYGFLRLRRWGLFLYLTYAGLGLLNATANFLCFGYGRVRSIFLVTLAAFTLYVLWRRSSFETAPSGGRRL